METPFFFKNENYNLFGVLHKPDISTSNIHHPVSGLSGLGIVFCHPFAEEKLISHRIILNLARELTKEGAYCLRFDYMGHGDSDGNFEDSTIETRLSDIRCAVNYLSNRTAVKSISLLGVRFGATLAALYNANNSKNNPLILIAPIVKGKSYIDQCLRSNLTTQMAIHKKIIQDRKALVSDLLAGKIVNIDGYLLTQDLYEQINAVNLLSLSSISGKKILIISINPLIKKIKSPSKDLIDLDQRYKSQGNNVQTLMVDGNAFWKDTKIYDPYCRDLQQSIANWLLMDSYL